MYTDRLIATLAAVGLCGSVSYSVTWCTEALLLSVMREVGRLAESQLFGVRAYDPWVILGAALLIAIVGLTAALAPAVRAMRIEPLRALRYE